MFDLAVEVAVLVFSLPVFAYSAYTVVLLAGSLTYRQPSGPWTSGADLPPMLSVLIAVYNEKDVVGETLAAVAALDYPRDRLQVIVADDSDDDTVRIVDDAASSIRAQGVDFVVARRSGRDGYKAGAMNAAMPRLAGEVTLLLDADSRVSTRSVTDAIGALVSGGYSFVSFRVGHYNREANLVTRSYALFQDTIDGLQKMGSTTYSLPYSLQGGFVLAKTDAIRAAGLWKEGMLTEDAELSCRVFAAGMRGAYLSGAQLMSEDPSSLRVWKRQVARVAQGWAQCLRLDFAAVLLSRRLGPLKKAGLLLTLLSPFASLSWIVVSFLTASAIFFGLVSTQSSLFSNPFYVTAVTLPAVVFYVAGANALRLRKMLTPRNLWLLPVLSYTVSGMFTISAIAFMRGLVSRRGTFFRTPKTGGKPVAGGDQQPGEGAGVLVSEGVLSAASVLLSFPMFLDGQYFLALSLLGFGAVTLKSMELSRFFRRVGGPRSPANPGTGAISFNSLHGPPTGPSWITSRSTSP